MSTKEMLKEELRKRIKEIDSELNALEETLRGDNKSYYVLRLLNAELKGVLRDLKEVNK